MLRTKRQKLKSKNAAQRDNGEYTCGDSKPDAPC